MAPDVRHRTIEENPEFMAPYERLTQPRELSHDFSELDCGEKVITYFDPNLYFGFFVDFYGKRWFKAQSSPVQFAQPSVRRCGVRSLETAFNPPRIVLPHCIPHGRFASLI